MSTLQGIKANLVVFDEVQDVKQLESFMVQSLTDPYWNVMRSHDGALLVRLKRRSLAGRARLCVTCDGVDFAWVEVPTTMPRLEQWRTLQSLAMLLAVKHGIEVRVTNKMRRVL